MTAPTPEQMRALAVTHFPNAGPREREVIAALRAAADQLEAVRRFASVRATAAHALGREVERDWLDLLAILTADTAPQETGVNSDGIYGATHLPIKEWEEPTDG